MPAMSPTMTEGGIVEWKFKEGESFSSGDVLLEIETDKAQIDVEAQDDGIVAKIYAQNGEKGIPVGKPIAVIAEPGDDISSIELPKAKSGEAKKSESEPVSEPVSPGSSSASAPAPGSAPASTQASSPTPASSSGPSSTSSANKNQTLFPSVAGILKAKGISSAEALEKIPASGPNGRLLKGDVLAYIGSISNESVSSINENIKKLSKLDLSNIKLQEKKEVKGEGAAKEAAAAAPAAASKPEIKTISGVFSLTDINLLKNTLDATLSTRISIENLVEKAVKLALRDVPKLSKPRRSVLNDPVFEELLSISPRGAKPFEYKISYPSGAVNGGRSRTSGDIYDILASPRKPLTSPSARVRTNELLNISVTPNGKVGGSEKKAQVFLDRIGYYLGEGKGDLVL